jgi:hypothetical protein
LRPGCPGRCKSGEYDSASFRADWDQQEGMAEALILNEVVKRDTGWHPIAGNLSTLIDVLGENQVQT